MLQLLSTMEAVVDFVSSLAELKTSLPVFSCQGRFTPCRKESVQIFSKAVDAVMDRWPHVKALSLVKALVSIKTCFANLSTLAELPEPRLD